MSRVSFSGKSESQSQLLYHLGALLAVTAWGASFISTKVLLQNGLNPVEIYVYRFVLAYLCTLLICPRPFFSRSLRDELMFMLCGVCGGSIYFIAENMAVEYTLVSNVSLLTTTSPLITAIIVAVLYKSERVNKPMIFGSLVALTGVGCVIFNSSQEMQVNPIGDMLALLAALCWAIYSLVLRPLSAVYSTWFISRKTFFYGVITALPFLALEEQPFNLGALCKPEVMGNLLFLGLFASLIAYLLWGRTVRHLGAVKAGNYLYLAPVVTLALSAVVLHEHVSYMGYIGCALILLGLIVSERMGHRNNDTKIK